MTTDAEHLAGQGDIEEATGGPDVARWARSAGQLSLVEVARVINLPVITLMPRIHQLSIRK